VAAACLKNEDQLPLRLIFQDEARFGRMSDPRSCWAPAPHRPVVNLALVREFRYEYAAVSPWDGCLDFMTAEKMNTDSMSRFLLQVSEAHKDEFIIMVVDGASSHRSKELKVPENVSLIRLPPYSPELNPAEQIWNVLRRDYFANRVFDSLNATTEQAELGLAEMAANKSAIHRLTNWPWISVILKT
jgi:transposase